MRNIIVTLLFLGALIWCNDGALAKANKPERSIYLERNYIVLQKGKSLVEQIKQPNTTYEIRYCYNLNKETVRLPEGCVLRFSGGIVDNGVIEGNNSVIEAGSVQIFGLDLMLAGYWNTNEINVCWFGAKNDITYNSTDAFKVANKNAWSISNKKTEIEYYGETKTISIIIPTGVYTVSGNGILGSIRDENSYPNFNVNSRYNVEGNTSIIYWEVNEMEDAFFKFDYSIGHPTVSDMKIFVANNTKEDYAGVIFKMGNKNPKAMVQGRVYVDASSSYFRNVHVVNSRKGNGGVYKVFDVIGTGMCDQALVQRCNFEGFLYCFYNINSEAVSWNFETCSFFTTAKDAHYFYLTRLSQYLMVNNCAFSYCDGQTLCEYNCELSNKKKLLGNDRDNIIFSNTRFEGYLRNDKEWFVVFRGNAGKLILQNTNFDASSSYKITHKFILSDLGSVHISNCALAKALFTIPKFTTKSFGLGDQNNWAIVSDNLRCDNLRFKGYDWEKDKLIDMTDVYLQKGGYYRYADFEKLRGKSSNGYKSQSFYVTPNTKSEVQYEEKSFSFMYGNTSMKQDILLPPYSVIRKIEFQDNVSLPKNVNIIRIYAGNKANGVYTDVYIAENTTSMPLFEGNIVVFDEDISKQTLYCTFLDEQGREVNVNDVSLLIKYIPLTDPAIYSITESGAIILKK